jgi:putative restriction endonuclease
MRSRFARYRRTDATDRSDFQAGCRILTQPLFFDERDWIPVPASWSPNVVSFKTYNTGTTEGLALWEAIDDRLNRRQIAGLSKAPPRFGEPHLIRPRLGQGAFRALVTDIYRRRCASPRSGPCPLWRRRIYAHMAMAAPMRRGTGSFCGGTSIVFSVPAM